MSDSLFSGITGWYIPSDPGLEYLGISTSNSTYVGLHYAFTYIPEPAMYYQDTTANMLNKLDTYFQPGGAALFQSEAHDVFLSNTLEFNSTNYGYPTVKNLTGITTTVCVYNCGVLPWTFSRAYAASGSNSTAVNIPYQRFSMLFSGIDTYKFQVNNHVGFNRDIFQLRYANSIAERNVVNILHREYYVRSWLGFVAIFLCQSQFERVFMQPKRAFRERLSCCALQVTACYCLVSKAHLLDHSGRCWH